MRHQAVLIRLGIWKVRPISWETWLVAFVHMLHRRYACMVPGQTTTKDYIHRLYCHSLSVA